MRVDGRAVRGALLTLGLLTNPDETGWRAGFVTSKRIGGAVVRNRVRRRLRDIVRQDQHQLAPGVWFVLVARPGTGKVSYVALRDEWQRLAKRARLVQG